MAIAQVTSVQLGTGKTSLSSFVAGIVRWLEERNAQFTLTPMGKVLEGGISEIFSLSQPNTGTAVLRRRV